MALYDDILREYGDIRTRMQEKEDERLREVCEKVPAYRALQEEGLSLAARMAAQLSSGGRLDAAGFGRQLKELAERKRALLEEASFPADYLNPLYECESCRDTGFTEEGRCHCLTRRLRTRLYDQSRLTTLMRDNNFSRLREDYYRDAALTQFRKTLAICREFIRGFPAPQKHKSLLFFGAVGSGKSFLSVCIAKELLDAGYAVLYFSAVDLFSRLSDAAFRTEKGQEKQRLAEDLLTIPLLIIDDLGTELTNAFVSSELFYLINERSLAEKATIISTNFTLDEIRARYSDRIFSRLVKDYTICRFSGRDIRLLQKEAALQP